MSEKLFQSNPEKNEPKMYWIPDDGQLVRGFVTGAREVRTTSPQKNSSPLQLRSVEVQFESVGPDGEMMTKTKMVSDHLLEDSVQEEYQKTIDNIEGEVL